MNYRPPRWLVGGHLQTIYPALFLKPALPALRREIWTTPDQDVIAVDLVAGRPEAPWLVLFHGLEGGSRSHYSRALLRHLQKLGWNGAVVHFRGCGGLDNRQQRAYHAGDSDEIDWILRRFRERCGKLPLFAVGVSLGGNALLKWLGERGAAARSVVSAAVGISIPFDLTATGLRLGRGAHHWLYGRHFLRTLKRKARRFVGMSSVISGIRTLYDFDDRITAPLHGFAGVEDYWRRSSCAPWLRHIQLPTLLLQARNDPFLPAAKLPTPSELSPAVELRLMPEGGHAGFVSGPFPGHLDWLPQTLTQWLESRA